MITTGDIPASWLDSVVRLLAALVCGGVIGWDRESEGRAAGLRTHMMVSLGAAAFTVVALRFFAIIEIDPARVLGSIVGGVGFLGAGTIMKSGGRVHGLTTAAGLWVVAAIGIACGVGFYDVALAVSFFTIVTLAFVGRLESIADIKQEAEAEESA